MTPYRSHGRGTLILKGTFAGVKIERASGTHDAKRLRDLKAMCRTLADKGRTDILQAMAKPRGILPIEVWQHSGDWSRIPTPDHARALPAALEAWRLTVRGAKRQHDLVSTIRKLLEDQDRATVGELPAVLLGYRNRCQAAGTARMFNKTRSELSSFVKDTLTQQHPLWAAVRAVPVLKVTRKRKGNPQGVKTAAMIRATLGAEAGEAWWAMCCTGMMPDEYFGPKWAIEDGRLHVYGTKTSARDRYAPLITDELAPSLLTQEQFQRQLKRAGLGVTPYDGRRTFKHWCNLAELPAVRSEIYMGHETRYRMETLYGTHESERHVDEDEGALRGLLARELVGYSAGQPAGGSRNCNGPTRNRTENLLIKSQPEHETASASPTETSRNRNRLASERHGKSRTIPPDGPPKEVG